MKGWLRVSPERPWLLAVLFLYLAVTLAYGVVNPLFEAPDEHWHFFTAVYVKENGRLPVVEAEYDPWLSQEAAQPPLAYLIGAALIAPIDTDSARQEVELNPYAAIGDASAPNNINNAIHSEAAKWPWRGVALAAHLLRALSAVYGLGTLLCIYGAGRLLWPGGWTALLATGLIAFLPQFNFLHASISNDPLIVLLAAAALWQLIRLWQNGVTRPRLALLGITIGLAALTKTAGIPLLVYAVGFLFVLGVRDGRYRLWGETGIWVVLPVLLLAGWLWQRNWVLYGDPTAANQFIRIAGGDRGYTLGQVLAESDGLLLSLVAVFGWFNLRPPEWVYVIWGGIGALSLAGAVWGGWRRGWPGWRLPALSWRGIRDWLQRPFALSWLLAGWPLAVYAGLATFMLRTEAAQGRLLFPALIPLALGVAWGINQWPGRWPQLVLPPLALLITVYSLFFVIRPAYELPQPLTAVPEAARWTEPVTFAAPDGAIQLVGVEMAAEQSVTPGGDPVSLTLYWRAMEPVTADYLGSVHLLGRELNSVGQVNRYPAGGMVPTGDWEAGEIYRDVYHAAAAETAAAPTRLRVSVSLYDAAAERPLPAATPDGVLLDPLLVGPPARLVPSSPPAVEPDVTRRVDFAGGVRLLGADGVDAVVEAGTTAPLTFYWEATAAPDDDYTVFVHLLNEEMTQAAGADAPPVNGFYPTSLWRPGDVVDDTHLLAVPDDLAPGTYSLRVGWYDPESGNRLLRQDRAGDSIHFSLTVR